MDGTLVPTRDHAVAEQSKNYRHSTNDQVVIEADTCLVVVVGPPLPGDRNNCKAQEESSAKAAVGRTRTIADGGYPVTGLVMPTAHARAKTFRTGRKHTTSPTSRTSRVLASDRHDPSFTAGSIVTGALLRCRGE